MLGIVDYKAGNQTSVARALEHLGIPCMITSRPADLETCAGIIFPGVGAAPQAMAELASIGMDQALREASENGRPLLGICLGSQIILDRSEEGDTQTLGILHGQCRRFPANIKGDDGAPLKIPHMGWNSLSRKKTCLLLAGIPDDAEFYFVHGYYTEPEPEYVIGTTWHGLEFCSLYGRDGLWCAQFHPEKSGEAGLRVLKNFNDYCAGRS